MQDTRHIAQLPSSFGALKPVGHVLVALKKPQHRESLQAALAGAGWHNGSMAEFKPRETVDELAAMVEGASGAAGFGYEITLMRRYLELARQGHSWLLVKVDDAAQAEQVAALARQNAASMAVHYRSFTVEELV